MSVSFQFNSNNNKKNAKKKKILIKQETGDDEGIVHENVTSLESNTLAQIDANTDNKKKEIKIIPLIVHNKWNLDENNDDTNANNDDDNKDKPVIPLLMQNMVPGQDKKMSEKERIHHDISLRPDDITPAAYENVAVEEYGAAMLRGMGWKPGEAIGGTFKSICKPKSYSIRAKGLGLGATQLKLKPSDNKKKAISLRDVEKPKILKNVISKDLKRKQPDSLAILWCIKGISVRVISKTYENGIYYKSKGCVINPIDKNNIHIHLYNENRIIITKITQLETVIPKIGETVMIVKDGSSNQFKLAILREKNSSKNRCIVELKDGKTVGMKLDDIAEVK